MKILVEFITHLRMLDCSHPVREQRVQRANHSHPEQAELGGSVAHGGLSSGAPWTIGERYARSWAARQGAAVRVVEYDANAEKGPAAVAGADVWVIEPSRLGRCVADGPLASLPGTRARVAEQEPVLERPVIHLP